MPRRGTKTAALDGIVFRPRHLGKETTWSAKRYLRGLYNRGRPSFVLCLFVYQLLFRLGFLDGREGSFCGEPQTFSGSLLIDAKLFEQRKSKALEWGKLWFKS